MNVRFACLSQRYYYRIPNPEFKLVFDTTWLNESKAILFFELAEHAQ